MARITIDGFQCERCEHSWVPRSTTDGEPTICPDCKSPYWNKPRIQPKIRKAIVKHFKNKKDEKNE